MTSEVPIPDDILEFVKRCLRENKIYWTYHVNMRLKSRSISRQMILDSIDNYEMIEEYPKDKYLPSYLIFSSYRDKVFHVLFAVDVEGDNVRIVTAYYPKEEEWEEDLKKRRRFK